MFKKHLYSAAVTIGMFSFSQAFAAGELNIFNWETLVQSLLKNLKKHMTLRLLSLTMTPMTQH